MNLAPAGTGTGSVYNLMRRLKEPHKAQYLHHVHEPTLSLVRRGFKSVARSKDPNDVPSCFVITLREPAGRYESGRRSMEPCHACWTSEACAGGEESMISDALQRRSCMTPSVGEGVAKVFHQFTEFKKGESRQAAHSTDSVSPSSPSLLRTPCGLLTHAPTHPFGAPA